MYSVKPGRGESFMGGLSSLGMAAFGLIWTLLTWQMGAPGLFSAFGLIFVFIGLASAAYNFFNVEAPNRLSEVDVTSGREEPDPLDERAKARQEATAGTRICPQCGAAVQAGDEYCPHCGRSMRGVAAGAAF